MRARSRFRFSGALALTLTGVLALGSGVASADEVPTEQEVADAQAAASSAADDVASVQAQLVLANQRADKAWIVQAQAAEQYNGARLAADAAARRATRAGRDLRSAEAAAAEQRRSYGDVIVDEYQNATSLKSLSGLLSAGGIGEAQEQAGSWDNVQGALDSRVKSYRATATVASVTRQRATRTSAESERLAGVAETARNDADAAAQAALAEADTVAKERTRLIQRLATLQDVSVQVAQQRQEALEQQAADAAAQAAQTEAESQDEPTVPTDLEDPADPSDPSAPVATTDPTQGATTEPTTSPTTAPTDGPSAGPTATATTAPTTSPTRPTAPSTTTPPTTPSTPKPTTPTTPPVTTPPAPGKGAQAAIAYAKAQLGEPYVWAAAGPNAWDCSGLTMKAWAAGGKSLPHWSVGQYRASTPISIKQLRPGDLLFWGSSSSSSSIYHVALYLGDDMMIHAPRPGKGVTIESMYYWITPNFAARP